MAGDFDLNPADYAEDHAPPKRHAPGSHRARAEGCTCSIIDNHYGRGREVGIGERLFYTRADCPYHLPPAPPAQSGE